MYVCSKCKRRFDTIASVSIFNEKMEDYETLSLCLQHYKEHLEEVKKATEEKVDGSESEKE